jgi:SET domain
MAFSMTRRRPVFTSLLLLLCQLNFNINQSSSSPTQQQQQDQQQQQQQKINSIECGIYLAPSSIPHAGLGMFVGNTSFDIDEIVTTQDVVIPIVDREYHTGHISDSWLFDEYIWNADVYPGMEAEAWNLDDISAESAGVGSAANSYLSLANVEDNYIELSRGPSIQLHSPGMGASTVYHGRSFFATSKLRPGQEIFVDYGTSYFKSRQRIYGYLPIPPYDYNTADTILEEAIKLTRHNERLSNTTAAINNGNQTQQQTATAAEQEERKSLREMIWEDLHNLIIQIRDDAFQKTSRVLNALPSDSERVEAVLNDGGTAYQDFNRSIMHLQWLESNGQCMDNIRVGDASTINHAGRGAFATRFIPSGGLVAPAPLIHVANNDLMKMYTDHVWSSHKNDFIPNLDGNHTYQLIYNYCFVHKDSKIALFPYGMFTNLINHASPPHTPNTRIQWSKNMRHPEWFDMSVDMWGEEYHTGLQIDFVALRDIEPGEEILIDYGDDWQKAWDQHVANFKSPYGPEYMPSYDLNKQPDGIELRIHGQDRDYESDHVAMFCRWWYLEKRGIPEPRGEEDPACRVLKKIDEDNYLAELIVVTDSDEDESTSITPETVVWGLPKDAFYFQDLTQTRDMHQPNAFRHPMYIPDDMFPPAWKNNIQESSQTSEEEEKAR